MHGSWQQLKQDPKKPTNTEVRQYLEHLQWLKSWATELPSVAHIPVVKRSQYVHEARALDAADMKVLKYDKRYALMVMLFQSHRDCLSIAGTNVSLKWIPEKWRKLVTGQRSGTVTEVSRKYFELCVLTETMQELQSGDLFVANSDHFSDYRTQLVDWDLYQDQVEKYGAMLGLQTEPKAFSAALKKSLAATAARVDAGLPENEHVDLVGTELILRKHAKDAKPEALEKIDKILTTRLPEKNILDILVESDGWLDLHKQFGPLSGFDSKVDDPRKRFITTLFCYGCRLACGTS